MDVIQLLPDSVANQIAAGEVIQRPASVIKELVENAIDAGATTISVLVTDAGKSAIQVIDNGKGMSDTDARLSFERHATSKIRQADDLFTLHTMGFRGEALASIAAVAQVTLRTRREEDEVGTRIIIEGSHVTEQEPCSTPVGSNFLVENLFFNVPARRKFLKSNATEMSHILTAFERIALVYPTVAFKLLSNGMEVKGLPSATLHQRINDIFGKKMSKDLLKVDLDTSLCNITGFVGKPDTAKKKGYNQYFFVNGRYMKHPYFHKAVQTAYDRLVPEGSQVSYFLYLTVDPHDIDVNIHPVKTEIKFENERDIWQLIMATVRNAIGSFCDITSLDFDTEGKPNIPVFNASGDDVDAPKVDFNPQYNPFNVTPSQGGGRPVENPFLTMSDDPTEPSDRHRDPITPSKASFDPLAKPSARGWNELFGDPRKPSSVPQSGPNATTQELFSTDITWDDVPVTSVGTPQDLFADHSTDHLQVRGMYILTEVRGGIMVVDQYRASQRILFEQYMKALNDRTPSTQRVLFPEVVQFPPSYSAALAPVLTELQGLGFDISDLGGGSYSVQGIPAGVEGLNSVSLVNDLVAAAIDSEGAATQDLHTMLATELARKAATPYGEILSNDDMETLMSALMRCATPRYTADGHTVLHMLSIGDISRMFG